jgi:hypothetical protein
LVNLLFLLDRLFRGLRSLEPDDGGI